MKDLVGANLYLTFVSSSRDYALPRWLVSRLGLAHLAATNLAVWLLALAREARGGEGARVARQAGNWTLGAGVMEEAG